MNGESVVVGSLFLVLCLQCKNLNWHRKETNLKMEKPGSRQSSRSLFSFCINFCFCMSAYSYVVYRVITCPENLEKNVKFPDGGEHQGKSLVREN